MGPKTTAPRFSSDGVLLDPAVPEVTTATIAVLNPERGAERLPHELHAARVPVIAALKLHGYTRPQIAKALKMSRSAVDWCIRVARERDLLHGGVEDALKTLDDEAVPLAIDAVVAALKRGDKDLGLKVLEGKGLLRSYAQVKNEGGTGKGPNMAFQFNFTMPPGEPARPAIDAIPAELGREGTKQIFGAERAE